MNPKEFIEKLSDVRDLMTQEKYFDAIQILDKLKKTEKNSGYDYNYDVIHQLYQLDSNCRSVYNQQIILSHLKNISDKKKSIFFEDLNQELKDKYNLNLNDQILRREVELLILRNKLYCKIDKDTIILESVLL